MLMLAEFDHQIRVPQLRVVVGKCCAIDGIASPRTFDFNVNIEINTLLNEQEASLQQTGWTNPNLQDFSQSAN